MGDKNVEAGLAEGTAAEPETQARADDELTRLRQLVLGDDYEKTLYEQTHGRNPVEELSDSISEAIVLRSSRDDSLGQSLAPIVDSAIENSIDRNPRKIIDIIFPILGPAIRKAVAAALGDMVQSLNTLLEQSVSAKAMSWRLQAWRSGVSYAQFVITKTVRYRVEQVLLVHRETGLLLQSVQRADISAQDPNLVSAMLTAVTDFVSDSFAAEAGQTLEGVRFGDLTLVVEVGPHAILALAVRGTPAEEVRETSAHTVEEVHRIFASALLDFDGDDQSFVASEPLLSRCLMSQSLEEDKPARKPWMALVVIAAALSWFAYEAWQWRVIRQAQTEIINALQEEPGYVLVSTQRSPDSLQLVLLHDNTARKPETVVDLHSERDFRVQLDATAIHIGPLPDIPQPEPPPPPSLMDQWQTAHAQLNTTVFNFESKSTELSADELDTLAVFLRTLRQYDSLSTRLGRDYQLMVMGFADGTGGGQANRKISEERANGMRDLLIENGVPERRIITLGLGNRDRDHLPSESQRRVAINVVSVELKPVSEGNGSL